MMAWCVCLGTAALLAIVPGWPTVAALLSSSDSPAWVQAIGTILAIAGAVWIAAGQERRSLHNRKRSAVYKARSFYGALAGAMENIAEGRLRSTLELRRMRSMIDEILHDARTIESELLNIQWSSAIFGMRSIGAQSVEMLRWYESLEMHEGVLVSIGQAFKPFNEVLKTEFAPIVVKAHPGVLAPSV